MRLRDFDLGQRVVVVVAMGAALSAVASYIVERYIAGPVWFGYVPLTRELSSDAPSLAPVLVWLATIAAWCLVSVWILGLPYSRSEAAPARGQDTE